MDIKIELRPHVGEQIVDDMKVDVELDQYIIMATYTTAEGGTRTREIGMVGKSPTYTDPRNGKVYDVPINWLPAANAWPPAVRDKMAKAVQDELASRADAADGDKQLASEGITRSVNDPPPDAPVPAAMTAAPSDDEDVRAL